jgi:hypothetical protein
MAVPYPSGIVAGDPLILYAADANNGIFTTPSGWASAASAAAVGGNSLWCSVFTKAATGSETGSLTVTSSGSAALVGAIVRYTGAAASPFGAVVSAASGATADTVSSSVTSGVLSPAPGVSDLVVRCYLYGSSNSGTGGTLSNPGGTWATRLNIVGQTSGGTWNAGLVIADKVSGTDNQTVTSSPLGGWMIADVTITAPATLSPPYPGLLVSRLRPYFG